MNATKGFGSIEMTGLVAELRAQNWECELTSDGGHWKAKPPDNRRITLKFLSIHGDFQGIVRQLRDHGFKWPPPPKLPPEPVVRAVPFPSRPHPHIEVEKDSEAPLTALAPPPPKAAPAATDAMQAFKALREAKAFEREAFADLAKEKAALDEAHTRVAKATGLHDLAVQDVEEKKKAVYALVEAEEVGT